MKSQHLLLLLCVIVAAYFIISQVKNLKQEVKNGFSQLRDEIEERNNAMRSQFQLTTNQCIHKIKSIATDNLQQFRKITELNHQVIKGNHFTETELEESENVHRLTASAEPKPTSVQADELYMSPIEGGVSVVAAEVVPMKVPPNTPTNTPTKGKPTVALEPGLEVTHSELGAMVAELGALAEESIPAYQRLSNSSDPSELIEQLSGNYEFIGSSGDGETTPVKEVEQSDSSGSSEDPFAAVGDDDVEVEVELAPTVAEKSDEVVVTAPSSSNSSSSSSSDSSLDSSSDNSSSDDSSSDDSSTKSEKVVTPTGADRAVGELVGELVGEEAEEVEENETENETDIEVEDAVEKRDATLNDASNEDDTDAFCEKYSDGSSSETDGLDMVEDVEIDVYNVLNVPDQAKFDPHQVMVDEEYHADEIELNDAVGGLDDSDDQPTEQQLEQQLEKLSEQPIDEKINLSEMKVGDLVEVGDQQKVVKKKRRKVRKPLTISTVALNADQLEKPSVGDEISLVESYLTLDTVPVEKASESGSLSDTATETETMPTLDDFRSIDQYTIKQLRRLNKRCRLPASVQVDGRRRNYRKDELYQNIRDHLKNL